MLREQVLRFSREIAFAAARIVRPRRRVAGLLGRPAAGPARRRAAARRLPGRARHPGAPRWAGPTRTPVAVRSGRSPGGEVAAVLHGVHRLGRRIDVETIWRRARGPAGGGPRRRRRPARGHRPQLLAAFGDGPVVVGPAVPSLDEATDSARAALAGFRAAPAWPAAPRPVAADDLLPERALAGDAQARRLLRQDVYGALVRAGGELLETLDEFFAGGGVLESAARVLFVHPNTVRYRLRRVAEITGFSPLTPAGRLHPADSAGGGPPGPLGATSLSTQMTGHSE